MTLPEPTNARRTVRQAIGDLPDDPDGANWHVGRNLSELSLRRFAAIPEGGNRYDLPDELKSPCWRKTTSGRTDVLGRAHWDHPSCTIRTEFFKPEKGRYLHPVANRPLTHREAARLQTFPDDFEFVGSRTQVARQIGNAVPVDLAEQVGRHLLAEMRAAGLIPCPSEPVFVERPSTTVLRQARPA
jgi:DNA (cytosine-5)-methyltransferase 1